MGNWRYYLMISIIIFLATIGIARLQMPILEQGEVMTSQEEYLRAEKNNQVELNLLKKIPSLGLQNLIADWTFLNFVQYYGDSQARDMTGYSLAPDYFEVIVKQDPRFVDAYFLLEPATTLFAGQPQISVDLISEGLEFIQPQQPLAYQLWLYKGIVQILFLNDIEGAKKSYRMAAHWARLEDTAKSLHAAAIAEQTAAFLEQNPDSRKVVASAWLMIFVNAKDDQTRAIALKNIDDLGGKIIVEGNSLRVKLPEDN